MTRVGSEQYNTHVCKTMIALLDIHLAERSERGKCSMRDVCYLVDLKEPDNVVK